MEDKKAKKTANTVNTAQMDALDSAVEHIEKNFGIGAVMDFSESTKVETEVISTGSLGLDIALGIQGIPVGRVIEIYGPESSGKTTLSLHMIAEAQKQGGVCVFVDTEHAFDPSYAKQLGVNLDKEVFKFCQPSSGEEALEIVNMFVNSCAVKLVVLDSVAALVPKVELEGDMGDPHMGLQARLMSQALRKLTRSISKSGASVIFINQLRQKIGVMFGPNETTCGGNALKFYSSIRLDIRRAATLKKGEESYGHSTRVKVVKNKLAPPFKSIEFDILFGKGISKSREIVALGVKHKIIQRAGAWYSYRDEKIGQGVDAVEKFLQGNPELQAALTKQILDKAAESLL